jgi:hypothetical protein
MSHVAAFPAGIVLANLFAELTQPTPTWTDKELLIAVGSTIVAAIPVCLFVIKLAVANARRSARQANQERNVLQKRVRELEKKIDQLLLSSGENTKLEELHSQLQEARQQLGELLKEKETTAASAANARLLAEQLTQNLESLQMKLQRYEDELATQRRRITRALGKDGQTWMERVLSNAPEFKPLATFTSNLGSLGDTG